MKTAITAFQMIIRIAGIIQIVLGLAFWVGYLRNLVSLHMLIGFVLVLSLWVLAVLAGRAGVSWGLAGLAIVWGVIVLALGLTQAQLLPGDFHWVIQLLHLMVGLGAMGLGDRLAQMSKHSLSPAL